MGTIITVTLFFSVTQFQPTTQWHRRTATYNLINIWCPSCLSFHCIQNVFKSLFHPFRISRYQATSVLFFLDLFLDAGILSQFIESLTPIPLNLTF
mmetsp:Transcript_29719/g.47975  ORF Transcript_29719/g.47975 Transcript_29719/m.47975 type:complete len:96 (+) Transcript_29719:605-892(+)